MELMFTRKDVFTTEYHELVNRWTKANTVKLVLTANMLTELIAKPALIVSPNVKNWSIKCGSNNYWNVSVEDFLKFVFTETTGVNSLEVAVDFPKDGRWNGLVSRLVHVSFGIFIVIF